MPPLADRLKSSQRLHLLIIIAAAVALLLPYFLHPQWLIWPNSGLGADVGHLSWPDLTHMARALAHGSIPLWDSSIALGHPLVGNLGVLWLYPPAALFLVLPPTLAFSALAALHLALAGTFTYFLLREFNASPVAALAAALAYMLMPKLVAHLAATHFGMIYGLAWMPAVLLAAHKRRPWPAALGGLALAMQFPGHPQVPIGTAYLLIGMIVWQCGQIGLSSGWRSTAFRIAVRQWVLAGTVLTVAASLVGAVWLLPVAELLPWAAKVQFASAAPFWYQMPPALLLTLLGPTEFQFPEWVTYAGIVPLLLACLALLGPRRRAALYLWSAVAVTLLIALGDATPVYPLAKIVVPGLSFFRTSTRLWLYGGFVLAVLAGFGMDALTAPETWARAARLRRRLNLGAAAYAVAGAVAAVTLAWFAPQFPASLIRSVVVGIAALAVLWRWGRKPLAQTALVALLLFDLLPLASSYMGHVEPAQTFLKPNAVVSFLASQPGVFRVYAPQETQPYALTQQLGVERVDGFLNLQLAHTVSIVSEATGCDVSNFTGGVPPCLTGEIGREAFAAALPDPAQLGLLNVRFVVAESPLAVADLAPVFADGATTVYENRLFQPRAFLQPASGAVTLDSRDAGRMTLTAHSDREASLVYSETWAPGWRATVNGAAAPVSRAEGALLGVLVPAGESRVTFEYAPLGWRVGWPVSLASLVGLILWGYFHRIRYTRTSP